MATGSGARHTAPAFQDSFSLRGAPTIGGASDDAWQIGNSEKSIAGATPPTENACAPNAPIGGAIAAAAPVRSKVRRLIAILFFSSVDIFTPGSGMAPPCTPDAHGAAH